MLYLDYWPSSLDSNPTYFGKDCRQSRLNFFVIQTDAVRMFMCRKGESVARLRLLHQQYSLADDGKADGCGY